MPSAERTPDVLIVGGGAIGVATALEVARRGARTVLLEAGDAVASGCSYGNAGLVCPSHAAPLATPQAVRDGLRWMFDSRSPFYLRPRPAVLPWLTRFLRAATPGRAARSKEVLHALSVASLELHREYAATGIETTYRQHGVLDVYETERAFASARSAVARNGADRLPAEVKTIEQARELVPSLAPSLAGAVLFPAEGHCDGHRFVRAVAGAAAGAGADIRVAAPVDRLRRDGDRVVAVCADGETIVPGTVVMAAGAWTPRLCREIGLNVPVEPAKGYHIDLEPDPSDAQVPVFMIESKVIATPLEGRLRLAGTLELAGMDTAIVPRRVEAVRMAGERNLQGLAGRRVDEVWSGLRPCPPDGLPIIGRTERAANLVLATGHGMTGLSMAPITGRLVAELIAGEPPSVDPAPFRPDRFRDWLPARNGAAR
jgi:D-amino-acid dehydrogenase